jgi:uncharacterized membrane-anchored protein YjiN (DUF445 family)
MAVPPVKSKNSAATDDRAAQFRRMRLIAGGLLLAMFCVFLAATLAGRRFDWSWLPFVRAFAEAAMVGAIADWFAVVALFRHPFGIPIPHTAIIARNKDRIGESLGAFICNNFLAPDVVAARLDTLDGAAKVARWLADPATAALLARRGAAMAPALLAGLEDDNVRAFVRSALGRTLRSVEAAPLTARILSALVARGHHQALFDRVVVAAEDFLIRNEEMIRARVSDRSWRFMPKWVDEKLADKVMVGLLETLHELRHPSHPWRGEFQAALDDFIARLTRDSVLQARAEAIKGEVLANPVIEDYLDDLWNAAKQRLEAGLAEDETVLRAALERALVAMGRRLEDDERLRAILNRWLRRAVDRAIVPYRGEIGAFIAGVVRRWDTRTLVDKLELQVGRDLQYIRINGTLVGGMVGLVIYSVARLLG